MFFHQLDQRMDENVNLHFTIKKKNGKLTVAVFTQINPSDDDKKSGAVEQAQETIAEVKPLTLTGTAGDFDKDFFNMLNPTLEKIQGLVSNIVEVEENIKEVKDEKPAKKKEPEKKAEKEPSPAQKKKSAEKLAKEANEEGKKLLLEEKYEEAAAKFETALETFKDDKKIKTDLEYCKKWIAARERTELFEQVEEKTPSLEETTVEEEVEESISGITDEQGIFITDEQESSVEPEDKSDDSELNFTIPILE